MKEKIEWVYNTLQGLDVKPTPSNTSKMSNMYAVLSELYKEAVALEQTKEEVTNDGSADGTVDG